MKPPKTYNGALRAASRMLGHEAQTQVGCSEQEARVQVQKEQIVPHIKGVLMLHSQQQQTFSGRVCVSAVVVCLCVK